MPFTRYAENKILNEMLGRTSSLDFGSVYLGLSTTTPVEVGDEISGITEPSGNGYARKLVGMYNQSATFMFGEATEGVITNNKQIQFDMATGNWGTCTHVILFDNTGNALAYAELPTPITPVANSIPVILAGNATFSLIRPEE